MPQSANQELYEKIRRDIYDLYPKHSAYISGSIVQTHRRLGGTYTGEKIESEGLSRWFQEAWTTQRGDTTYKHKNDIFRPNIEVNENTPATFSELSKKEIKRARREKTRTGRVNKFTTQWV